MSSIDSLAKDLFSIIRNKEEKGPKPYEPVGEVVKVDEANSNILWVKIPGGDSETPVEKTVNAKPGDRVRVRVAGGRAWVVGNASNPPTDDTRANEAAFVAYNAEKQSEMAIDEAERAKEAADTAWEYADSAHTAATNAWNYADDAHDAANEAHHEAETATGYANNALTQLGVVEDVVGVLEWVSEHATYKSSTDTEVVAGKMYFTKSGDIYTPVANPTGNPSTSGYYEIDTIDEAVSNYVSSHLALTNQGLWVVNDNSSYKILLASDGMKVYDTSGHLVSTFGENIEFSSNVAQYIGGDDAYIVFNPITGAMVIGGSKVDISGNVTIGGQTRSLAEVLNDMQSEIDGSIETWYLEGVPTVSNQPAVNWTTTAQKSQHLRDLYFDTSTGHTYRWAYDNNEYKWIEIEDTDATAALRMAENSIKIVEYASGTSPTIAPVSGWGTSSPTWTDGSYIWMRQSKDGVNYTYTCIQGAKGEDAVNISIISSEGTVFRTNTANTTLEVFIYRGATEIRTKTALEANFGAGTYLQWQVRKYGDPSQITIPSTYEGLSNDGFSLSIGADDVNRWTVYTVKIITV